MTATRLRPKGSASGAKAEDAEFFATDLSPQTDAGTASLFRISIVATAGDAIEVTWNSGTAWEALLSTSALTANTYFEQTLFVRSGDTVNFRCPTTGGITLDRFTVDEEA